MTVTVTDVPAEHRFEARVDGKLAGFARYIRDREVLVFTHTEVDPAYKGQRVGTALARGALDTARAAGLDVVAACSFISAWIGRHPEYQGLVYRSRSDVMD
jgi:uncharacterized protein